MDLFWVLFVGFRRLEHRSSQGLQGEASRLQIPEVLRLVDYEDQVILRMDRMDVLEL